MNPTPADCFREFADAIHEAVDTPGHARSVAPQQEPMTDAEVEKLKKLVDELFKVWG